MNTPCFRGQIQLAVENRGELTLLHSQQGFQVYPGAMILADLLLRDVVAAVGKGLDGFHPVASLNERLRFEMAFRGEPSADCADSEEVWALLCRLFVGADAPAVYEMDENEVPQRIHRQLMLGHIPVEVAQALAVAIRLEAMPAEQTSMAGLRLAEGEVALSPVARLAALDGPVLDGAVVLGLQGAPVSLRTIGGEQPVVRVEVGLPWHRVPAGVAGGRGVLMEDVRGLGGIADFLFQQGLGRAVAGILHKLDAGADAHGQPQVGFRERVSALWDETRLGAEDLLDAVTDVLPVLAAQLQESKRTGAEISSLVLEQGIVDLVTRLKARPVLLRQAVAQALDSGLAPHVASATGEVYWVPVGEFPETFLSEQHDSRVLPEVMGLS